MQTYTLIQEQVLIYGGKMKEILIYGTIYLIIVFVFLLFVFRVIYFTFVIKQDPLQSVKVIKAEGIFKIYKQEKKQDENSKWG